jgi:hypothetical protein
MSSFEQVKKYEKPGDKLDGLMRLIADKLNAGLLEAGGVPLVENDCSVKMEAFEEFDVEGDKNLIWEKDLEWSDAADPNVQKWYKDTFGVEGVDQVVTQYRKNKERAASGQVEKAVTAVFYKILASEYAVVRSSTFDDYFSGIDNVIINKKTGDVICAFDEVHGQSGQERYDKKLGKVKQLAKSGGATLKYGFSFEDGSLIKKSIANVPVFYLALSSDELRGLLAQMGYGADDKPNEAELRIFDKLIAAMEEQAGILEKERLPQNVRDNLNNFCQSSERMKQLRAAIM